MENTGAISNQKEIEMIKMIRRRLVLDRNIWFEKNFPKDGEKDINDWMDWKKDRNE